MLRGRREEERSVRSFMRERFRKRVEERGVGETWTISVPEGVHKFTPKKGTMNLDIIPYVVSTSRHPEANAGEQWMRRTFYTHVNVGVDDEGKGGKVRICLNKTFGKKCPICEYREELIEKGGDRSLIDSLRPKIREVYNVIDLDEPDKGVQVWDVSYHLFTKQLEKEIREGEDDWAGFSELEGGYTVKVRFDMKSFGKGEPFPVADRIDFKKRKDYDESILKKSHDLDKMLVELSYEQLEREFLGLEEQEENKKLEEKKLEDKKLDEPVSTERLNKKSMPKESERRISAVEPPERKRRERESDSPKCPGGGVFGEDCDSLDACQDCSEDIWMKCGEVYEQMTKSRK